MFVINPPRADGESDIGFFLRLLVRNGYSRCEHIVNEPELKRIIKCQRVNTSDFSMVQTYSMPISQSVPMFKMALCMTPKVCIACLREDGQHKNHWMDMFTAQCEKHQQYLINKCQTCEQLLTWQPSLLEARCTNEACNAALVGTQASELLSSRQTADALVAAHIIYHAKGNYIRATQYFDRPDYQGTVELGLEFLQNPAQCQQWLNEQVATYNGLPVSFKGCKLTLLQRFLKCQWPSTSNEPSAFIEDTNTGAMSKDVAFVVNVDTACTLLQVDRDELTQLLHAKLVCTVRNTRLNIDALIDMGGVVSLLRTATSIPNSVCLSSINCPLDYYGVSMADVLIALASGKLAFSYTPSATMLDSISCDKVALKHFCIAHFESIKCESLSLDKAARLIGKPIKTLMRLNKRGKLRTAVWTRYGVSREVRFDDVLAARQHFGRQGEFDF